MNRQEIEAIFEKQKAFAPLLAATSVRVRKKKLRTLRKAILKQKEALQKALYKDLRKNPVEVDLNEIFPLNSEIKYVIRHLKFWMRPKPVNTPLIFKVGKSFIKYEPKGQALIITPWNYPFILSMMPVISAIASGNTVILKPSEHSVHTSKFIKDFLSAQFDEEEIAVVTGDVETAKTLLDQPFNHIHFTGSPEIGKIVMRAAATYLASVTLELGGKTPVVVDKSVNVDAAARRIAWSKFLNAGQICIAPDYVMVHESQKEDFIQKVEAYILKFFGENPSASDFYGRLVDERHFVRLEEMMRTALQNGATLSVGGDHRARDYYIGPTVLDNVPEDSALLKEEIFGPLLPIVTFRDFSEVIDRVNGLEKSLISYIYSKNKKNIGRFINETRSGGVCVNHGLINLLIPELPFGGSNTSGIGKSKGYFGYHDFSNQKAVYKQILPWSVPDLIMPPYTNFKKRLISIAIKWF